MHSPQEIELKLLVPLLDAETALKRLRQVPALRRLKPRQQRLENRYFDTPDQALRRQRCALRLRQTTEVGTGADRPAHQHWVQTLKTAGTSTGGLSQRGEWESTVSGGELDLKALADTAWASLAPQGTLFPQLQPCFTTQCLRTTWRVRRAGGAEIEVALDAGHIQAGQRTEPILELELELISGEADALFELAQAIALQLPLWPCDASKAERGYALAAGEDHRPARARPVPLKKRTAPQPLGVAVLSEILEQFQRNLQGLLLHDDPELVHQARVAWRRWRSVTRLLNPWLPPQPDRQALQPLLDALGHLRDLDVALHDTLPRWQAAYTQGLPGLNQGHPCATRQAEWDRALAALTAAAEQSRQQVRDLLGSPATGQSAVALARWLHELATAGESPSKPAEASKTWATDRLARWQRRLDRLLDQAHIEPALLHEARLLAKRLRYGSEAVMAALPASQARRARRWTATASAWQESIGLQRDLSQAAHVLESLRAAPALTGFLRGIAAAHAARPL